MKRLLVVLLLSSSLSYANNSTSPDAGFFNPIGGLGSIWEGTGEILGEACNFIRNGFTIPGTNPEGILQGIAPFRDITWLCTMSDIYNFVNTNILNGDWQQFGGQMVVQWINDLGSFMVKELGLNNPEGFFNGLYNSLESGYRNFRMDAMFGLQKYLEGISNRPIPGPTINPKEPLSPEGLVFSSMNKPLPSAVNKRLDIGKGILKTNDTTNAAKQAEATRNAIEANNNLLKTVGNTTGNVLGTPAQPGIANKLANEAKTANDLRQVAEIQVEATSELLKLTATYNNAISSQLGELIKQQAMTNQELQKSTQSMSAVFDELSQLQEAYMKEIAQTVLTINQETGATYRTTDQLLTLLTMEPDTGVAP